MHSGLTLCFALPLLAACGSDSAKAPASPGKVTLAITGLRPDADSSWAAPRAADPAEAGAPGFAGDPEPVVIGCDRRLGVTVEVANFYLRAPDACGGSVQCGYLAIDLYRAGDDQPLEASVRGASLTVLLDLASVDLSAPAEYTLVPSLLRPNDVPFTGPFASDPLPITVTLSGAPGCSPTSSGGAGGASGAGNEPNVAGAGGHGGAPNP